MAPVTATPKKGYKQVRVVEVGGKSFVTGLFWQTLTQLGRYMAEAKQIGKSKDMDMVAIREGSVMQAGFVSKDSGVTKAMYSLSACLADQLGSTWLGAFRITNKKEPKDNEYVLIGLLENAIIPATDFVGSFDEVSAALRREFSAHRFQEDALFAPPEFEFAQKHKELTDLLAGKVPRKHRLKQLSLKRSFAENRVFLLGGVAIAVAGYFGADAYLEYKNEQVVKAKALEAAKKRELERLKKANPAIETKALEHPWVKMPVVDVFMKGCRTWVESLPLDVGGFTISSVSCSPEKLSATFNRNGGTFEQAMALFRDRFPDATLEKLTEGKGIVVHVLTEMAAGTNEDVWPRDQATERFVGVVQQQEFGNVTLLQAKLTGLDDKSSDPKQSGPKVIADFSQYSGGFTTESEPYAVSAVFGDLPGLRVTKMDVAISDVGSFLWTVKVDLYVKN